MAPFIASIYFILIDIGKMKVYDVIRRKINTIIDLGVSYCENSKLNIKSGNISSSPFVNRWLPFITFSLFIQSFPIERKIVNIFYKQQFQIEVHAIVSVVDFKLL